MKNTINPLPRCLAVIEYKVARKALRYLGLVQNIDENEYYYIQFLKKSGETTFTVKVGDKDMITKDKIIKVINLGQYIVNYLATNLDMWTLMCLKQKLTSGLSRKQASLRYRKHCN